MVFTTKHVMYQVKESVFVTYMYAGIFHLPQYTYTSTASTPHVLGQGTSVMWFSQLP